jgi:hypothetical protein
MNSTRITPKHRTRLVCIRLLLMGIGMAVGPALSVAFGSTTSLTGLVDQWYSIMAGAAVYAILARGDIRDLSPRLQNLADRMYCGTARSLDHNGFMEKVSGPR